MTNTVNDVSGYEDIIFNFRAYPIQNEDDYLEQHILFLM